jgi:Matrixin
MRLMILTGLLFASCVSATKSLAEHKLEPPFSGHRILVPATLVFGKSLSDNDRVAVIKAAAFWNQATGQTLFALPSIGKLSPWGIQGRGTTLDVSYEGEETKDPTDGDPMIGEFIPLEVTAEFLTEGVVVFFDLWGHGITPEAREEAARHELGHALGLAHIPDVDCIVYPYIPRDSKKLKPGCVTEFNVLKSVYAPDYAAIRPWRNKITPSSKDPPAAGALGNQPEAQPNQARKAPAK